MQDPSITTVKLLQAVWTPLPRQTGTASYTIFCHWKNEDKKFILYLFRFQKLICNVHDFKLLLQCKWDLCSSGMLCSTDW